MSIITIDNQLIHYEVLGRGEPVLFIHGWLGSWRYWWPAMQGLSAHHRTFALDLWGFGDSSKVPAAYSIPAYVEMIEQFLNQLGVSRPLTLIGHGLGAAVSLKYAQKYHDHVKKLITIALPVKGNTLNSRLAEMPPDEFISRVMGKSNSFPEIDMELRKTDQSAVSKLAAEIYQGDFENDLANSPCPILSIYGAQDVVVTASHSNNFYTSADSRYLVKLDNCAHFPMLEETVKFNRLLLEFIHADDAALTEIAPKEYWQRRVR